MSAAQALDWGLVNAVHKDEDFAEQSAALTARLAAARRARTRPASGCSTARLYSNMAEQLELEATLQQEMVGSDDFVEGVGAFLQKRPARFSGR